MNKILQLCSTLILISSSILFTGCPGDCVPENCTENSNDIQASVNGFDLNPQSAYYNQVVANFSFTQTHKTYSNPPNECTTCPNDSYSVKLKITNETNKSIQFDYSINFNLNLAAWNYQNVATIGPNSTLDVGQISANGASISLGRIIIQSANISYH
jgi:hypothetical protein